MIKVLNAKKLCLISKIIFFLAKNYEYFKSIIEYVYFMKIYIKINQSTFI